MFTNEEALFSSSDDENIEESGEVEVQESEEEAVEHTGTIVSVNLKHGTVNNVALPSSGGKCNVKIVVSHNHRF